MKGMKALALALVALVGIGALGVYLSMQGLGDLRTDNVRAHGPSESAQQQGRALLARSLEAMGGSDRWQQLRDEPVEISFEHDWHHWVLETFFMPLEFSGQSLTLSLKPGSLDVGLKFLDGEWAGEAWGILEGETYTVDSAGVVSWERDETIEFHLHGYRYFFFVPFLLSDADLITYAGSRELHGETYDLVYATWDRWEPHESADQYLLWIHRETLLVDFVQSTVREMMPRSIVALSLTDYREVLGIRLPFSLKILEDIEVLDAGMHHMRIQSVESATEDASSLLRVRAAP